MFSLRFTLQCLVAVIIFALSTWWCFENSLSNGFTFDDHLAIEGNGDVDSHHQPYFRLWFDDIWGKDLLSHDSHRSYRPLLITIFRYLYGLAKKPELFRVISIVSHGVASVVMFVTGFSIFTGENAFVLSSAATVLFITHPVHVESVTAAVNMAEPLSAILIMLSYLIFYQSYKISNTIGYLSLICRGLLWWILLICSVLLKETGIVAALLPFTFILGRSIANILFYNSNKQSIDISSSILGALFWMSQCLLFIYLYFALRGILVNSQRMTILSDPRLLLQHIVNFALSPSNRDSYLNASQLLRRAENPFAFLTGQTWVMSTLHLYTRYFFLLLYPYEQSPEYSFNCISAVESWQDMRNVYSLWLLSTLLCIGLTSLYYTAKNRDYTLFHIMLWLIIPFIPLTGIVFTLGTLLAERLLYLCSIGYCFLFVYLLYHLIHKLVNFNSEQSKRKGTSFVMNMVFTSVVIAVCSWYSQRTRKYNQVWKSDETLFLHAVKVCPTSAKSNLQVSKLYSNRGDMVNATRHLLQARSVDSAFCDLDLQEAFILLGPLSSKSPSYTGNPNNMIQEEEGSLGYGLTLPKRLAQAERSLLRSLHCIYTSRQALGMLQQIWDLQMATAMESKDRNQVMRVHYRQGKAAYRNEMHSMAVKRLAEAASMAFELKRPKLGLKIISKAEISVQSVQSESEDIINLTNWQRLACRVYTLAAGMRSTWMESVINEDSTVPSRNSSSWERGKKRIITAAALGSHGRCVLAALTTNSPNQNKPDMQQMNAMKHAQVATMHGLRWLNDGFSLQKLTSRLQEDPSGSERHAIMSSLAISFELLSQQPKLQDDEDKKAISLPKGKDTQNSDKDQTATAINQAMFFLTAVAQHQYLVKQYSSSARLYAMILAFHILTNNGQDGQGLPLLQSIAELDSGSEDDGVKVSSHISLWKRVGISKHFNNDQGKKKGKDLTMPLCQTFYWYADSLAGLDDFHSISDAAELVLTLLRLYGRCVQNGSKLLSPGSKEDNQNESNKFAIQKRIADTTHLPITSVAMVDGMIEKFTNISCSLKKGGCS